MRGLGDDIAAGYEAMLATAKNATDAVATPVFDALGSVIGYIAGVVAPIVGTHEAVTVATSSGEIVGQIYASSQDATAVVMRLGVDAAVPLYNAAGEMVGNLVKTIAAPLSFAAQRVALFGILGVILIGGALLYGDKD